MPIKRVEHVDISRYKTIDDEVSLPVALHFLVRCYLAYGGRITRCDDTTVVAETHSLRREQVTFTGDTESMLPLVRAAKAASQSERGSDTAGINALLAAASINEPSEVAVLKALHLDDALAVYLAMHFDDSAQESNCSFSEAVELVRSLSAHLEKAAGASVTTVASDAFKAIDLVFLCYRKGKPIVPTLRKLCDDFCLGLTLVVIFAAFNCKQISA